jgi:hypothetical protein
MFPKDWIFIALLGLFSCKESASKNEYPAIDVTGYLKGQLKFIDTVAYGLLKVTEKEGSAPDSVYLNKQQVKALVDPFLSEEISQEHLETNYTETSFADASTSFVTITYKTKKETSTFQQIDVYIEPQSGAIRQLYLTGFIDTPNGLTRKQLLWFHNKGGNIISTPMNNPPGNLPSITERLIWL